jgi:hypothetical protein
MTRFYRFSSVLAFCGVVACSSSFAQSSASSTSQSSSPAPASSPAPPSDPATAVADPKKAKRVWTNDDVHGVSGPVSVVGNSKNVGKTGAGEKTADGQYIANTKKELAKLQTQLDDTDKQLADLKDFSEGRAPATSGGYQVNKGYNRTPVDQQITGLEAKKLQLQDKIGALLDEARKKGVEPGDLR